MVACVLRFLGWKILMLGLCWLVIGRHLGEGKLLSSGWSATALRWKKELMPFFFAVDGSGPTDQTPSGPSIS